MAPDARTLTACVVAVFLALGTGIAVGTLAPGQEALVHQQQVMIGELEDQFAGLRAESRAGKSQLAALQAELEAASSFAEAIVPAVVAGRLAGERVALVWADGLGRDGGLVAVLGVAGAEVVAEVELAGDRAAAGVDWPAAAGRLAAWLVRAGAPGGGADGGLDDALAAAGVIEVLARPRAPAAAVVLVGGRGGGTGPTTAAFDLPFLRAVRGLGAAAVAAERRDAPRPAAAACARDGVSTVDGVDTPAGKVALVWLLAGGEGHFGRRPPARAALPDLASPWGLDGAGER